MEPDDDVTGVPAVDSVLTYPAPVDTAVEQVSFDAFYRDTRDRTARALALTIGDGALAAEAVDEAMARAYQRWSRISGYDEPAGWVYRVALNWATSFLRRRSRVPHIPVERGLVDIGPIGEPDVAVALAELGVRHRAVVVCRYYLGWSEAEIAAALGIRPGTVKSRMHRALHHLKTRLDHLRPEEQS